MLFHSVHPMLLWPYFSTCEGLLNKILHVMCNNEISVPNEKGHYNIIKIDSEIVVPFRKKVTSTLTLPATAPT